MEGIPEWLELEFRVQFDEPNRNLHMYTRVVDMMRADGPGSTLQLAAQVAGLMPENRRFYLAIRDIWMFYANQLLPDGDLDDAWFLAFDHLGERGWYAYVDRAGSIRFMRVVCAAEA
jgi:hypothetical protein